jgi:membrane protein YdbS with pleckstrin-like domain
MSNSECFQTVSGSSFRGQNSFEQEIARQRRQASKKCATLENVTKIILEILKLFWKFFRQVIWKYLRPYFTKVLIGGAVFFVLLAIIVALVVSGCLARHPAAGHRSTRYGYPLYLGRG